MFVNPAQMVRSLPVPPRARVGDFGAGSGRYALLLAERVGPDGVLYALDAFPPHLDAAWHALRKRGVRAYALHADLNEHIPLATNLLNVAVVANLLHQLNGRARFAEELARVVAPGGRVLVVEWAGSFGSFGPPAESVMTPGEATRLFSAAGFSPGPMLPAGTHHFAFVATNRAAA